MLETDDLITAAPTKYLSMGEWHAGLMNTALHAAVRGRFRIDWEPLDLSLPVIQPETSLQPFMVVEVSFKATAGDISIPKITLRPGDTLSSGLSAGGCRAGEVG